MQRRPSVRGSIDVALRRRIEGIEEPEVVIAVRVLVNHVDAAVVDRRRIADAVPGVALVDHNAVIGVPSDE
jgi:hypothetical protein